MQIEDARSVLAAIRQGKSSEVDASSVADMLMTYATYFYDTDKNISKQGVLGAPDWLGYEDRLWKLSEEVRQFLKKRKDLKGTNPVLNACKKLAMNECLGKGRQNLVLILGEFGGTAYSDALGTLLSDRDVLGHAVKALVKSKSPGFQKEVEQVLSTAKEAWIKAAAKKYLSMV